MKLRAFFSVFTVKFELFSNLFLEKFEECLKKMGGVSV